jgi:DNA modification methylase
VTLPTADDPAKVIVGDSLAGLRTLPDGCVHCCVTSPPYWSLRDYQVAGQIGLEPTPAAFVARLVEVFEEVRRVLHPSGVLWCNMGDSYAAARGGTHQPAETLAGGRHGKTADGQRVNRGRGDTYNPARNATAIGLKHKDLVGVPWMLAFALRDAGWYLRSDIIWAKPSPMPESVTDRCTKSHEYVFMLAKRPDYYFDAEAIKEDSVRVGDVQTFAGAKGRAYEPQPGDPNYRNGNHQYGRTVTTPATRNKRTVWTIASEPYPEAHFATFPPALVEPMVKAGSSERGVCPACWAPWRRVVERETLRQRVAKAGNERHGRKADSGWRAGMPSLGNNHGSMPQGPTVKTLGWVPSCKCPPADPIPSLILDPFAGSGTTLAVAVKLKRRAIGIELNAEYAALAEKRLAEPLGTGGLFSSPTPVVVDLFADPAADRGAT